jgi:hypothetical protein
MKAQEFCYWLQGMFELSYVKMLNAVQLETVRKHLQMVFLHDIDPSYPAEQQTTLNQIHSSGNNELSNISLSQNSSELIRC